MELEEFFTVPVNVSEGRNTTKIVQIREAFSTDACKVVDVHSDTDHHRTVYTLLGKQQALLDSVISGVRETLRCVDLRDERGVHPHIGIVDVIPVVYYQQQQRGAACAQALVIAHEIGKLGIPVFLYGDLADGMTRAKLRAGGVSALARRVTNGEQKPDFGPQRISARIGGTLISARKPLVAVNFELGKEVSLTQANEIANRLRGTSKDGLPGVRALAFVLEHRAGLKQISCNVEEPERVSAAQIVAQIQKSAPVKGLELVGLAPACFFVDWDDQIPIYNLKTVEKALRNHVH